jgi:diguanylate cyclase (GGDEF)-like protein/PAS domain S-box-containing protein
LMIKRRSGKLFVLVSVFVALTDLMFVYMNHHFAESAFRQNLQKEGENLHLNFQTLLSQTYSNMLTIATFVASDEQVQQVFLQGQKAVAREGGGAGGEEAAHYRKALYGLVGGKWNEVQKKFSARQLHFHLGPGSTSFLRVHRPDKFGDNMDDVRFTIVDTNREQTPRTGFETGRVYSGLRGVVPVTAFDTDRQVRVHVGALEVGTSFNVILKILHDTSNYSAGVLLTRAHVAGAMWPEALARRFGGQDVSCECVIEAASDEGFSDIIAAGRGKGIRFRDGGSELVQVGEHSYLMSYFPVRDYLGERDPLREDVGAVVFWKNVDQPLAELRSAQFFNILYGIFGFLVIESLFFIALKVATRRLQRAITEGAAEIRVVKERLSEAQAIARVGSWEHNLKTGELWCSDQMSELFGLTGERSPLTMSVLLGKVHPEDRDRVATALERVAAGDSGYTLEHRLLGEGGEHYLLARGTLLQDADGMPSIIRGTVQDVTALKQTQQRLADVIWATDVGIWDWHIASGALTVNERWAGMMGYAPNELAPLSITAWEMLVCPEDLATLRAKLQQLLQEPEASLAHEFRVRHRSGRWVWVLARGRVVERSLDGAAIRISGSTTDISGRKASELKVTRLATLDTLTGLYNRSVFNQRLDEMIALSRRTRQVFSLVMLDLDGFKPVNDQYGHPVGDKLLKAVAAELAAECRQEDIAARLGGDEFAVVLASASTEAGCEAFTRRVLARLSEVRMIDGCAIRVSASAGFCLYGGPDTDAEKMIHAADVALYRAKKAGKNCYFSAETTVET